VNDAYSTLQDCKKRAAYDRELAVRREHDRETDLSFGERGWGPSRWSGPPQPRSTPPRNPSRPQAPRDLFEMPPDSPSSHRTSPRSGLSPDPPARPVTPAVALAPDGFPVGAACPSCGEPVASRALTLLSRGWDGRRAVKMSKLLSDIWCARPLDARARVTNRWDIDCGICGLITGSWVEGTSWPPIHERPGLRARWWQAEQSEQARRQLKLVHAQARRVELARLRRT
jgi:hypothetical protein